MSEFRFQLPAYGFTAPQIPGIAPTGRHRRRCVRRRIAVRRLIARGAVFAALIVAGCEAIIEGGEDRA